MRRRQQHAGIDSTNSNNDRDIVDDTDPNVDTVINGYLFTYVAS